MGSPPKRRINLRNQTAPGAGRPPKSRKDLRRLAQDYVAQKQADGLSQRSWEGYQQTLERQFLPWAHEQGLYEAQDLEREGSQLGRAFSLQLQDRGLAVASRQTYLRQTQFFLDWLWKEGELKERLRLPTIRPEHRIAKTLEPEQLRRLQHAAFSERDALIIQLIAETGIRSQELRDLQIDDLVSEQSRRRYFLKVRGKGARDRRIGISPALGRRLERYISLGRPQDAATDHIFVSLNRSRSTGMYEALGRDALGNVIDRAAERAGLDRRQFPKLGPHLIRKSFTRNTLRSRNGQRGLDSESLRQVLGHTDTRMIREVYGQLQAEDVYDDLMAVLRRDRR